MKFRKLKALPLALVSLFSLTSCAFLDNIINGILVNTAMNTPILMNYLDLMQLMGNENGSDAAANPLKQFTPAPTSTSKRADIYYMINPLLVPEEVTVNGISYTLSVDLEYSNDGADAAFFKTLSVDLMSMLGESGGDLPIGLKAHLIFPVGTSTYLDDVESLDGLMNKADSPFDLVNETKQEAKEVSITLKVSAGNKMRKRTYHFNLVKPDFGSIVVDQVFNSGILFNLYDAKTQEITSISEMPSFEDNPYPVEYLKQTIAVPHKFEIKGIGEVTVDATPNNPELYFASSITKNISELDEGNTYILGDVTINTYTPIGDYKEKLPPDVDTIEKFKDHLEVADKKELYKHATAADRMSNFSVTVTSGEETKTDDYFFRLKRAPFEEEILDYVMDTNYIINKVNYKTISETMRLAEPPTSEEKAFNVHYLVDAVAIPSSLIIEDLGDAELTFEVTFKDGAEAYFYHGIQSVNINEEGVRDVFVNTYSPIGAGVDAIAPTTPDGDIQAFAEELKALPTKRLYQHATKPDNIDKVEVEVTASLMTDSGPKYKAKTYFLNLKQAEVDQDIVDTVIKDFNVLNTGDFNFQFLGVDNSAKESATPKNLTYFWDTLIIPKEVTLKDYDNRLLQFDLDYDATIFADYFFADIVTKPFKAEKDQETPDEVTLYSFTPVGTFDTTGNNTVEDLLNNFKNSAPTLQAEYESQTNSPTLAITVTAKLNGKEATATYYIVITNDTPFMELVPGP